MAQGEDLQLQHKEAKKHFGDAEEGAYRLGGYHALENIAARAEKIDITAVLEEVLGRDHLHLNPETMEIFQGDGRLKSRWHTLGSFAMTEVFGHTEPARQLGTIVNDLIAFAIARDRAHLVELEEQRAVAEATRDARDKAMWDASLEGGAESS